MGKLYGDQDKIYVYNSELWVTGAIEYTILKSEMPNKTMYSFKFFNLIFTVGD